MKYIVYQITHTTSGKIYIGKHQTIDVNDGYMGSGRRLRYAIKKYGVDAFTKTILHVFDNETAMNDKERELVTEEFCARKDTYNICPGGKGGFGYINNSGKNGARVEYPGRIADKQKASAIGAIKLHNLHNNPTWLDEHRQNVSQGLRNFYANNPAPWLGKQHSDTTKQKMSNSHKGKRSGEKNGQFGSVWYTNGIDSKPFRVGDDIPTGWIRGRKINRG